MARKIIFQVTTPLGYQVTLTRNRWREITRFKHPAVAKYQKGVKQCLKAPDIIRASTKDKNVHLYYLEQEKRHLCIVVAGDEAEEDHFVVTAYFTERVKSGDELWTK